MHLCAILQLLNGVPCLADPPTPRCAQEEGHASCPKGEGPRGAAPERGLGPGHMRTVRTGARVWMSSTALSHLRVEPITVCISVLPHSDRRHRGRLARTAT